MAKGAEKKRRQLLWAQWHLQEELYYRSFHPFARPLVREANAVLAHQMGMKALKRAEEQVQARLQREKAREGRWWRRIARVLGGRNRN